MNIANYISEDQQTVTIQLKAVPVKEGCCNCGGCFFEDDDYCTGKMCYKEQRNDGMEIIWVKQ